MVGGETAVKPRPTVACRTAGHVSDNAPAQQLGIWVLAGGLKGVRDLLATWCADCAGTAEVRRSKKQRPCSGYACSLTSCREISKKSGFSAYCVSATSYIFDSDDRAGVKCSPTPQLVVGMDWSGSASGGREVPQGPAKLRPNRWWERYRAAAGAVTMRST